MDRRLFLASAAAASSAIVAKPSLAAMPFPIDTWEMHRRPRDYEATPGKTAAPAKINDIDLVIRLVRSYRQSFKQSHYAGGMWTDFFMKKHGRAHDIFMSGSPRQAARLLRNPSANYLHYGFDETYLDMARLFSRPDNHAGYATSIKMQMLSLAEAGRMFRMENPEQYSNVPPRKGPDTEALMRALDAILGIKVDFPNPFPDEYGLQTSRGVAGFRATQSLYQAYRIMQLTAGIENPNILEIGAGTGRTAYYCHRLGLRRYSIVDLPFTAISHGYFLGRVLGHSAVALDIEMGGGVKLISPDSFLQQDVKYDLIVNVDSLTEIPLSVARRYWVEIQKRTKRFWSINHEANQHTMSQIAGIAPAWRFPCWMRRGYAEELYRL
jgi:hypothetical protein